MTVTIHSPFRNSPRISEEKFVDVLYDVGSFNSTPLWGVTPSARETAAREVYRLIVEHGHDPAIFLAIAGKEHTWGTNQNSVLWRNNTRSWTNARSVRHPEVKKRSGIITDSQRRSQYVRYASVYDSVLDGLYRVDEPGYAYRQAGAVSIVEHIRIWAPGSDDNQPDGYARTMVMWIAEWMAGDTGEVSKPEEPPMTTKPRIALAAGHHNSNRGGAAGEYERVGPLTREIANQLRAHGGFDVHVITPNDGLGDFPGGLQDVAKEAVSLNADCFLEVHMEGVGNPAVRGCFAIYPDTPPDVDADVRDRLGLDMARRVRDRTGLPLRGNGTMSERSTGVGGQGYRLGAFSASASARQTMERMLFEYGTLTNSADTQIINGAGFNAQAARATVEALIAFYDVSAAPSEPQPEPDPDALYQTKNPFGAIPIRHGFRGLFEAVGKAKYPDDPMAGGLSVCGYAEGPEYETSFGSAQRFQRVTMLYYRDASPPWDLVMQHRFEAPPEPLRKDDAA